MAKNWRNLFELNQVVQIFAVLVAVSLIFNTVKVVQKNFGLQAQVDKLKDEITILELRNQQLKYDIEYYKTDEYLELAARQKFNKKATGERVVALPDNDLADPDLESEESNHASLPQYQENFQQWLYFLFGKEPS